MKGIMDECTHIANFATPVDTSLIIAVCAMDDAYVPRGGVSDIRDIWPEAEVRYVDGGHVLAFVLQQKAFRLVVPRIAKNWWLLNCVLFQYSLSIRWDAEVFRAVLERVYHIHYLNPIWPHHPGAVLRFFLQFSYLDFTSQESYRRCISALQIEIPDRTSWLIELPSPFLPLAVILLRAHVVKSMYDEMYKQPENSPNKICRRSHSNETLCRNPREHGMTKTYNGLKIGCLMFQVL